MHGCAVCSAHSRASFSFCVWNSNRHNKHSIGAENIRTTFNIRKGKWQYNFLTYMNETLWINGGATSAGAEKIALNVPSANELSANECHLFQIQKTRELFPGRFKFKKWIFSHDLGTWGSMNVRTLNAATFMCAKSRSKVPNYRCMIWRPTLSTFNLQCSLYHLYLCMLCCMFTPTSTWIQVINHITASILFRLHTSLPAYGVNSKLNEWTAY